MNKKTLAVALTALLAMNAHAKVTFETAVEQDRAARANNVAVDMGALVGGISQTALESSSGNNWKHHWSGSTIGSIGVPSNAKEIFVVTSGGSSYFPKNSGSMRLNSVSASGQGGTAIAYSTYSGSVVTGGSDSVSYSYSCSHHNGGTCYGSTTAKMEIKKIMYK